MVNTETLIPVLKLSLNFRPSFCTGQAPSHHVHGSIISGFIFKYSIVVHLLHNNKYYIRMNTAIQQNKKTCTRPAQFSTSLPSII